jgi:hypothetical protein
VTFHQNAFGNGADGSQLPVTGVSRGELRRRDEISITGWRAEYVTRSVLGSNPSVLHTIRATSRLIPGSGAAIFMAHRLPARAPWPRGYAPKSMVSLRVDNHGFGRRDNVNPAGPVVIAWRREPPRPPRAPTKWDAPV